MCIELYPHNEKTYNKINELWETTNKVAACQPTGTGKSFLILKCAEKFNEENIVILTPQIHIIEQFQKHDKGIVGITYITYAKLQFMTECEIKELNPKLIVFDEFHRCGAEEWGNGVKRLLDCYPNSKVLGTSATPIRFLDGARDMSDELFDNNIACNMTLPEALIEGILTMPKYVSALYTFDEEVDNMIDKINKSKNSDEEKVELINDVNKLKNKLNKSKGIPKILNKHIDKANGRYLVFCKNKDHMEEMKPVVIDWFNKYFKISKLNYSATTYEVYSDLQDSDEQLEMFIKDDADNTVKLLFCINMLNEGVHISNLDGVILLRPTTSPTMYYQQIGRAIDAGRKEQSLILDLVNNFSSIRTNTLKEDLEKKAKEYCSRVGISGDEEKEFIDKFKVVDESCDVLDLFSGIERKLNDRWNLNIEALVQFKNRNGHCNVPIKHIEKCKEYNVKLGEFCHSIKSNKTYLLTKERMYQLNEIGFNFEGVLKSFDFWYSLCVEIKNETGDCNVPSAYKYNNYCLGCWQSNIRSKYKNHKLTNEEINRLIQIGFEFNLLEYKWNMMFLELIKYYKENGSSNIPSNYEINGLKLGSWVLVQRRCYKNGKLSIDKVNKLLNVDFKFTIGIGTYNTKDIINIETKNVFCSAMKASKWCNLKGSSLITSCLLGKFKSAGKHPETGEPLHWMYYDEYIKLYGEVENKTA